VTQVGERVSRFKVGDIAGVGCMVDSCQHCAACEEGLEQYYENITPDLQRQGPP
jgi:alcohol dehydrogenase (NADP+)